MKTWLITGVAGGLGLAVAELALARGDRVIGTVRQESQRLAFAARHPDARGVLLDIAEHGAVTQVVAQVQAQWGAIDILLNNAGYAYEIPVEEAALAEVRRQFEVNVLGTLAVTQAVLPLMRARRAGHILTVSSIGGLVPLPGLGIYNGSKFALEGMFAALAREVAEFGVKVTLVEPGMLRTGWDGRSMLRGEQQLADYAAPFAAIRQSRLARHGKQPGDPHKAALAILAAVDAPSAPSHLLLGRDALAYAQFRNDELAREFRLWAALTKSVHVE